jgi:hypothetical protein
MNITRVQVLVKECYGLSLSDQYWIRPENSALEWARINFFDNPFSEDVGNLLFGGGSPGDKKLNLLSPDSTSDGQLRKKWKIINGKRCLLKGGSTPFHQEPMNEVIASEVCRRLDVRHVDYSLLWDGDIPYSACEDFITGDTDLVSAWQICNTKPLPEGADLYAHFTGCCRELGIPGVTESIDSMLAADYIIANTDRHFSNFGAIRNAKTLEWVGMAPLFDNGTSLWCQTANFFINPDADVESATFRGKHSGQLPLIHSFNRLNFPALEGIGESADRILSASRHMDEERIRFLRQALTRRVELLNAHVQSLKLKQTRRFGFDEMRRW